MPQRQSFRMNDSLSHILKSYAATSLKCVMLLTILMGVIYIPWLIASEAWNFLYVLMHEHLVAFIFLLIPTLYLSVKLWQWLCELLGTAMMLIGSLIDKLEKNKKN